MTEHLPFSGDHTAIAATTILLECKNRLNAVKQTHVDMQRELHALDIEISGMLEINKIEQDITFLDKIWAIAADWNVSWERWKGTSFNNLDVEDMVSSVLQFNKVMVKLGNDDGVNHHCNVWEILRDKVYLLQRILPIIQDLKNPAMRLRHWESLQTELFTPFFDPASPDFNIESILNLNLYTHAEFIRNLSHNCNEELRIETSLADIELRWKNFDSNMNQQQKLDVLATTKHSQTLNNDFTQLNTMKTMKLAVYFQEDLTHCEETLNTIRQSMDDSLKRTTTNCDSISTRVTEAGAIYTS